MALCLGVCVGMHYGDVHSSWNPFSVFDHLKAARSSWVLWMLSPESSRLANEAYQTAWWSVGTSCAVLVSTWLGGGTLLSVVGKLLALRNRGVGATVGSVPLDKTHLMQGMMGWAQTSLNSVNPIPPTHTVSMHDGQRVVNQLHDYAGSPCDVSRTHYPYWPPIPTQDLSTIPATTAWGQMAGTPQWGYPPHLMNAYWSGMPVNMYNSANAWFQPGQTMPSITDSKNSCAIRIFNPATGFHQPRQAGHDIGA